MRPVEHESWEAYLKGQVQLPHMDWETNQSPAPTSKKSLKIAHRRAKALNRLYKSDQARPSHSVWFTQNHIVYLPLVKAMARVIGIERHLRGGSGGNWRDARSVADLRTIRKIISTSSQIHRGHGAASKMRRKAIDSKIQVLVDHQRRLQRVIKEQRKAIPVAKSGHSANRIGSG